DNSFDNNELDNMYQRLNERYTSLMESTGINDIRTTDCLNDTIYDLGGRKQEKKPKKGIYIMNGKKRLVK
ncbi:MAG: hypothetical protein II249_01480, partial [Bacteroidaceae bacterium]|nr:hypothetical protein [Bacteroidaceae bacterium]